jgi:uncharacterized delta-60 repeat protein
MILASATGLSVSARADVSPDPSFGGNGIVRSAFGPGFSDTPHDLLIQPDGKILTAGISENQSTIEWFIAMSRHTSDGVLDSAGFGVDGKVLTHFAYRDQANAIALQSDGKIVAAGMHAISNASSEHIPSIYRFNPDGTVDLTFADSGYVSNRYDPVSSGEHAAVTVRPNGRLVAAGRCSANANGGVPGFGTKQFLPDGTGDVSARRDFNILFNRGSCAFYDDGRILWANTAFLNGRVEFVMCRTDSLGAADTTFGGGGVVVTGIESAQNRDPRVLLLPDGKILLAGTTPKEIFFQQFTVFRFSEHGIIDSTFGTNGRTDVVFTPWADFCRDVAIDADGRILLVGGVQEGPGLAGLARLLPDGSLDPTFSDDGKLISNLNNGVGTHYLTRVVSLPDGNILAAGYDFASNGGDFLLVRYAVVPTGVEGPVLVAGIERTLVFPNPSRGETVLQLRLASQSDVNVEIFDAAGRSVRRVFDGHLPSGTHALYWDGRDETGQKAPSGIFFTKISTPTATETAKILLIR